MKKLKYSIVFVLTIIALDSCDNNFDPEIYGSYTQLSFPATESDCQNLVANCYLPFTSYWQCSLGSGNQHTWFSPEGGVMRVFDTPSDIMAPWTTGGWSDWLRFSQSDFSNCVNYTRGSVGQNVVNHFVTFSDVTRMTKIYGTIQSVSDEVLGSDAKQHLLAEVRLCRGMHMYYAFHTYGPMPFITDVDSVKNEEALSNMSRPTLNESTEKITEDLEYAVANMPEKADVTEQGRYNKDYARFCLMRHCLNEGEHMSGYYQRAVDMYNELLKSGYSLFSTGDNPYAAQFTSANKFNSEVIMAISVNPAATNSSMGNYNADCMYMFPSDAAFNIAKNPAFGVIGASWSQYYNISTSFYDSFESGDKRRDCIVTSYVTNAGLTRTSTNIGSNWSGYILNKFKPEVSGTYQPMDVPMARWADVLLMYAEALTRRDNVVESDAITAVNEVRNRAGLGDLASTRTGTVNAFLEAILAERGHELYFKGCRKIDLIRFNEYARKCYAAKGVVPTSQYMPLPNFAVQEAAEKGVTLEQTYAREGWASDVAKAKN